MSTWLTSTLERNESLRFEALGLLDQARAKMQEAEGQGEAPAPGKDAAQTAVTILHLTGKSLLAARGFRALSARLAVVMLKAYYPNDIPDSLLTRCGQVQGFAVKGQEALAVAREFLETAEKILSRSV